MSALRSSLPRSARRLSTLFSLREASKLARAAYVPCRVWRVIGDRLVEIYFHGDRVTHVAFGISLGLPAVRALLDYDEDWFIDHGVTARRHTLLVEWDRLLEAATTPTDPRRPSPEDETCRIRGSSRMREFAES